MALLGLLLAPALSGCLLFTDSFNTAATVEVMGPTSLFRGQPGTFHAKANEEIASFDWGLTLGPCPTSLQAAEEARRNGGPLASTGATADTLVHPFVEALDGCVFVIVVDKGGARSFAGKALKVRQRELIIEPPALVERRKPASFTAVFRDDATATAHYRWYVAKNGGTCDEAVAMLAGAPPASARYEFEPPNAQAFCIAVKATDQWNIDTLAKLEVSTVQAGPPVAKITVVQPAAMVASAGAAPRAQGLFTQYRLSALPAGETVTDPGQVFRWTLAGPSADAVAFEACATGLAPGALDRTDLCFSATKAGNYTATLAVTEDGTTADDMLTLTVEDVPPCIRQTSPSLDTGRRIVWLYDQDLVFRVVEVGDDADPVPAPASGRVTQGAFAWARRLAGANPPAPFVPFAGETLAGFTLPGRSFAPGDEVEVRVQYQDRIDLTPGARPSTCQADDSVCERAAGSSCYQWLTWTVVYL